MCSRVRRLVGSRSSFLKVDSASDQRLQSNHALTRMAVDRGGCSRAEQVCMGKPVVGGRRMVRCDRHCEQGNWQRQAKNPKITDLEPNGDFAFGTVFHSHWCSVGHADLGAH